MFIKELNEYMPVNEDQNIDDNDSSIIEKPLPVVYPPFLPKENK